jgi:hypothetical protein
MSPFWILVIAVVLAGVVYAAMRPRQRGRQSWDGGGSPTTYITDNDRRDDDRNDNAPDADSGGDSGGGDGGGGSD